MGQPNQKQLSVKAKYQEEKAKRRIDNAERRGRRQSDELSKREKESSKNSCHDSNNSSRGGQWRSGGHIKTPTCQPNQTCQRGESISQCWQPEGVPHFQQQVDSFSHRDAEEGNLMERLFLAVLNVTSENTAIITGMIGEFDSMMVRKAINDPEYLRLVKIAEAQESLHESWHGRDPHSQAETSVVHRGVPSHGRRVR